MSARADVRGQVARPRVADRDRRVLLDEQEGRRHADDGGAPDDDGVSPCDLDPGPAQDLDRRVRGRRQEAVIAEAQEPGVERVDPVDVLGRVDGVDDRPQPDGRRERHLDDDAIDGRIVVERTDRRRSTVASVASPSSSTKPASMPTFAQPRRIRSR